jgi:hypothetical protein
MIVDEDSVPTALQVSPLAVLFMDSAELDVVFPPASAGAVDVCRESDVESITLAG